MTTEAENTWGDGTTLGGGTLIVNGSLPPGTFNISAGTTLGGHGTIRPAVTLPSGATLAPGNKGIGTLTVSNNVTLQVGSVARIELNKAAGTHDQLRVTGTLDAPSVLPDFSAIVTERLTSEVDERVEQEKSEVQERLDEQKKEAQEKLQNRLRGLLDR